MLGSLLIMLSYIFYKELRTTSRLLLFHLSLMDFGVGLANFVGDMIRFERFYVNQSDYYIISPKHISTAVSAACQGQAFIALFCTISSVLWTCILAVYMYMVANTIASRTQFSYKHFMWFSYTLCYGLPFMVTLWTLLTGRLGYAPYNSSGWCSLKSSNPWRGQPYEQVNSYVTVFAYDLWMVLTILMIAVLYISTHYSLHYEVSPISTYSNYDNN